jgi:hypothetical protein
LTQQAVAKAYSDWRAAHSRDIGPETLRDNAGAFQVSGAALTLPGVLDAVKANAAAAKGKADDLIKGNRGSQDGRAGPRQGRDRLRRIGHLSRFAIPVAGVVRVVCATRACPSFSPFRRQAWVAPFDQVRQSRLLGGNVSAITGIHLRAVLSGT